MSPSSALARCVRALSSKALRHHQPSHQSLLPRACDPCPEPIHYLGSHCRRAQLCRCCRLSPLPPLPKPSPCSEPLSEPCTHAPVIRAQSLSPALVHHACALAQSTAAPSRALHFTGPCSAPATRLDHRHGSYPWWPSL